MSSTCWLTMPCLLVCPARPLADVDGRQAVRKRLAPQQMPLEGCHG
jgi:hypothetical protein